MIEPTQRRSATVVACEYSVLARLSEAQFADIASRHPDMYRFIARELARRLGDRLRAELDVGDEEDERVADELFEEGEGISEIGMGHGFEFQYYFSAASAGVASRGYVRIRLSMPPPERSCNRALAPSGATRDTFRSPI